jgi:hypothetical protein
MLCLNNSINFTVLYFIFELDVSLMIMALNASMYPYENISVIRNLFNGLKRIEAIKKRKFKY